MTLATVVRAGDLFDNLGEEQEQEPNREFEVNRSPEAKKIIKMYERLIPDYHGHTGKDREFFESQLPGNHDAIDITAFVANLIQYENDPIPYYHAGPFISALINTCRERDIVIPAAHLSGSKGIHPLDSTIQHAKGKNIKVTGNTGSYCVSHIQECTVRILGDSASWLATGIRDSEIYVEGDVTVMVGSGMKSGKIYVKGNARSYVGHEMKGGEIYIDGDAGIDVGSSLREGTIYLNESYQSLGVGMIGGNIYHKGKLIVENGRRLVK